MNQLNFSALAKKVAAAQNKAWLIRKAVLTFPAGEGDELRFNDLNAFMLMDDEERREELDADLEEKVKLETLVESNTEDIKQNRILILAKYEEAQEGEKMIQDGIAKGQEFTNKAETECESIMAEAKAKCQALMEKAKADFKREVEESNKNGGNKKAKAESEAETLRCTNDELLASEKNTRALIKNATPAIEVYEKIVEEPAVFLWAPRLPIETVQATLTLTTGEAVTKAVGNDRHYGRKIINCCHVSGVQFHHDHMVDGGPPDYSLVEVEKNFGPNECVKLIIDLLRIGKKKQRGRGRTFEILTRRSLSAEKKRKYEAEVASGGGKDGGDDGGDDDRGDSAGSGPPRKKVKQAKKESNDDSKPN